VVQLSEGRFRTPESGSGLRFYYGREGMRKNRHVWADRDEHVTVHRSGGGRGGNSDTSVWPLLLWGAGIIAGIILLYYLWDVIQVLIVLMILGTAARLLLRK
jgi:hypothetical protein